MRVQSFEEFYHKVIAKNKRDYKRKMAGKRTLTLHLPEQDYELIKAWQRAQNIDNRALCALLVNAAKRYLGEL